MTNIKSCTQTKCTFHKDNTNPELCPKCDSCGTNPHLIDEDCVNCWNCKSDEGFIRTGTPQKQAQPQKEKMIEVTTR